MRRLHRFAGLVAACTVAVILCACGELAQPGVAQAQLFGSSSVRGTDPGSIFLIDLNTGVASLIGTPADPNKGISDLSFDPATGALFAIEGAATRGAELLVLDPATADVTSRIAITSGVPIRGSDALVFDSAGTLFVGAFLRQARLLVVDPLTGVAVSDTPVEGVTNLSDLAWDSTTSELWASFGGTFPGRLVTLDPLTAQVTSVLDINQSEAITGIAFDSAGTLYGSLSGSQLVIIDKATGDVTPIGTGFGGPKIAGLGFSDAAGADDDGDGVLNDDDICPGTVIAEGVPTVRLNPNHWALTDDAFCNHRAPARSWKRSPQSPMNTMCF